MDHDSSNDPHAVASTLKGVAEAAHVSISTVSRSLRNDPRVSEPTRRRVHEAARRLGYRPNPYLTVLMTHLRHTQPPPYSSTLAWLDRSTAEQDWRHNPVQTAFDAGARARAEALGFRLERINCSGPVLRPARIAEVLKARGIHGALCSADLPDARLLEFPVDANAFAAVTVGCRFHSPGLHYSLNDQFATAALGYRRLRALGYRRIALLTTHSLEAIVDHRFVGGYLAMQATDAPGCPPMVHFHDGGGPDLGDWLRQNRPDALLTSGQADPRALVAKCGLSVPGDIAAAVLDWNPGLNGLAGVNQNHDRVGAGAVDLVVAAIRANEYGIPARPHGVLVESAWVEGASAPPCSGRV